MTKLLTFFLSMALLAACASRTPLTEPKDDAIATQTYELVYMEGLEASLERDIRVLGRSDFSRPVLTVREQANGKLEWTNIKFYDCLGVSNPSLGALSYLHHCTKLVVMDGATQEYLPFTKVKENFLNSIIANLSTMEENENGVLLWKADDQRVLATFQFMEAAE